MLNFDINSKQLKNLFESATPFIRNKSPFHSKETNLLFE